MDTVFLPRLLQDAIRKLDFVGTMCRVWAVSRHQAGGMLTECGSLGWGLSSWLHVAGRALGLVWWVCLSLSQGLAQNPDSLEMGTNGQRKDGGDWHEHYESALRQAATEDKPVFAVFTGSDWCSWCMKYEKEILSQDPFKAFAREHLVLLMLDYPSKSVRQPDWLVEQNRRLKERYGIRGYPTAVLLSAQGEVIATSGYLPGGATSYVAHLRGLLRMPPQGMPLVDADSVSARKMSGSSHADAEVRPLRIIRALMGVTILLLVILLLFRIGSKDK